MAIRPTAEPWADGSDPGARRPVAPPDDTRGAQGRDREPPAVRIVPAVLADLSSIGEILTEAARWATSLGVVGAWPVPYPPEWIQGPLERGEVYLAYVGPEPVGTLTLQWSDPSVWGARAPDAGYVHKLASRRSPLGRGSGRAMLAWAAGEVQARDRPWLRLDTRSTHAGLRRYYLDLGFRIVGTSTVREMEVVLLERDSRAPWPFPPR